MPAWFLLGLFDSAYVLALTAWVGSVLFFSFAVAPTIFAALDPKAGDKLRRALVPRYYAWGAISGAIALPASVAVPLCYPEYRGPAVGIQSMVILASILTMLYAGNSLTPAIDAARDAGALGEARFNQLHRRSVWLNALVLMAGLGLLIVFANRRAPRTAGIPELTPGDRAQFDARLSPEIERLETKYGFRRQQPASSQTKIDPGSAVDPEMIKELESYYQQKRLRDLSRKGQGQGAQEAGTRAQEAGKPQGE